MKGRISNCADCKKSLIGQKRVYPCKGLKFVCHSCFTKGLWIRRILKWSIVAAILYLGWVNYENVINAINDFNS